MLVVAEPMCRVGVVGLAENKANSAPIELELELSLAIITYILDRYELLEN